MMCFKSSTQKRDYKINSKLYEQLKIDFSKAMSIQQSGKNNSQFGQKWIYNLELRVSKRIQKDEEIPKGWKLGKIQDFQFLDRCCKKCGIHLHLKCRSKIKMCKLCKNDINILILNEYYNYYKEHGFLKFRKKYDYSYSQQNLVKLFQVYLHNFIPQRGKRR